MWKVPFLATVEAFFINEGREFPNRQSIDIGNLEFAHKRMEAGLDIVSFDFDSAEGIGPVEDENFDICFCARPHDKAQRADKGIGPGSDILDVIDHNVNPLQHLRGRLPRRPVERINGKSCPGVRAVSDVVSGIDVAADAVFGPIQSDKIDLRRIGEDIYRTAKVRCDAAGVCHQSDTLSHKRLEAPCLQDFDAGTDCLGLCCSTAAGAAPGKSRNGGKYQCKSFHFLPKSSLILPLTAITATAVAMQVSITNPKYRG